MNRILYYWLLTIFAAFGAAGDYILPRVGSGTPTLIAPGTNGHVLQWNGGLITPLNIAATYQPIIGTGTLALSALATDPLARANHTGLQAIATTTGLQAALDAKMGLTGNETVSGNKGFTGNVSFSAGAGFTGDNFWGIGSTFDYEDGTLSAAHRTALGLGTLATQSGTFSGTSSGTNTGDQTLPTAATLAGTTLNVTIASAPGLLSAAGGAFGTAAFLNSGTSSGNVLQLGTGGIIPAGITSATGLALSGSQISGGTLGATAGTNLTGTALGLSIGGSAATVTTNANLTGHVTSTGNAAVLGSFTLAQLSTAVSDANIARTDAAQTLTGNQTISGTILPNHCQIAGGGYLTWTSFGTVTWPSNGVVKFTNSAETSGIVFDIATDGTLKIRNRSNTAATGSLDVGGAFIAGNVVRLKGYTVATLPASPTAGDCVFVTDALTPTYQATVAGGGAVVTKVFYNGSAWTCQ